MTKIKKMANEYAYVMGVHYDKQCVDCVIAAYIAGFTAAQEKLKGACAFENGTPYVEKPSDAPSSSPLLEEVKNYLGALVDFKSGQRLRPVSCIDLVTAELILHKVNKLIAELKRKNSTGNP